MAGDLRPSTPAAKGYHIDAKLKEYSSAHFFRARMVRMMAVVEMSST